MAKSGPELFIALAGAVGTDFDAVYSALANALVAVNYRADKIHLAGCLRELPKYSAKPAAPLDQYIAGMMDAGDDFRLDTGRNDAVALLAIARIRNLRKGRTVECPGGSRTACILRSLKHPEEVERLRQVYGRNFYLVAAYTPQSMRTERLANQIAVSRGEPLHPQTELAKTLIDRDRLDTAHAHGQDLQDTFHLADYFLDASNPGILKTASNRFVEIIFGNGFLTPSKSEYAMFHAQAAALRSAELGRQVGAAISDGDGSVVAVGTNEVPKAGGGLYWCDDILDSRQFRLGFDSNDAMKLEVLSDTLARLADANWIRPEILPENPANRGLELARKAVNTTALPSEARIRNLVEFGRAVHAEMAAIADAARRGVSIRNCDMFVTTFPCHLCARHILAAGIRRVLYIEPYSRSLAPQLYPDSISIEDEAPGRVQFAPFLGVAPRQYLRLFADHKRKGSDGSAVGFDAANAEIRYAAPIHAYTNAEEAAIIELKGVTR